MKTLFKILGAIVALLIITVIAIPFFVSADMLKARVADELSQATGRVITIEGNATLKIFPDIAVSLEKVTLGNPKGDFTSERMFYAAKLDTGVRLMPLLDKEIIITGVTLDGAEINLEETKSGQKNWEFTSTGQSDTKQEKKQEAGGKSSKFAIGDIAVKNSGVNYAPANGQSLALSNINLTLSGADGNAPLALDGDAEYKGKQVSLSLDVKDSRGFLNGTASSPIVADIALPGGSVRFSGTAEKKTEIAAKGELRVDISTLPELLQWFTGKPASGALPKTIALQSPVSVTGKRVALSAFNATADDMKASGKLTVDVSGSVPSLIGAVKLGVIDLARFTSASKAEASAKSDAPAAGGDGWSSKPIDLSALKTVNAKLGIALDGVKSGKLEIGKAAMDVNLQNGALKLGIDALSLYGGNARGGVSASTGGIATALRITDVQIEPLLVALNGSSKLMGTAALELDLRGSGNSQKAIASSLGGTANMTFRDGKIKGINLGEFLRNARQGKFYADDTQATDFAELSGSWSFANGVGSNNDLLMRAPVLRMTGTGTVSLPARSLNYKLMPTLVASSKGQGGKDKSGITVPLLVTGPWSKPQITPDLASMIRQGLEDPEGFKNNLKNIQEGIKDFNSPSDIGKALLGGKTKKAATPATETPATTETAPAATSEPAPTETETPAPAPAKDRKQQAIENLLKGLGQ